MGIVRVCIDAGILGLAIVRSSAADAGGVDRLLGLPYPSNLVAAPVGNAAAWVYNVRGVRNIWVAGKGAAARQITGYTQDDGFDIGDLAWSADARMIAFMRGQTIEDDKPANVISAPTGPAPREIWTVATSGSAPRMVGAGHAPVFAPDGSLLVYLDKHQMIGVDPRSTAAARPLVTDFGTISAASFSPDGKRIAFVSERATHSLVGVYDRSARTIAWLAPSLDFDSQPVFSPDGSKIAFVRVPTEKLRAFVSRRSGLPWSIWVADVATGAGRQAWAADKGAGSVFQRSLSPQNLFWSAGNRLVFPWEKTGWLLPYAVDIAGGAAKPLAAGSFELAYMALSPDRRRLVYASNQDDPDRLHIWSVDPAVGAAARLSGENTIEAFPEVAPDGTIFALQSSATTPLHPVTFDGIGWRGLGPAVDAALTAGLVVPQAVSFRASDGRVSHGQVFVRPGPAAGKRPAVLFFHGGPRRQMLLGFHYMGAYNWMYAFNQYLVSRGYVVLSVNYRGGIGYGLDYREADGFGPDGASEVGDLLGALTYVRGRGDIDTARVGIYGLSYGGLMTGLGLARAPGAFAAGVDAAGVYNWASMLEQLGAPIDDPTWKARAVASSPVATIDKWRAPVLVVQADDDRNVPSRQSTELVRDLRAHGVPNDVLMVPNEVHDFTRFSSWSQFFAISDAFLARYLAPPLRP